MAYHENVLAAIGNTPLVKLGKLAGPGDATVLVKLEYLNPGGSIKDRMAIHIVEKAEQAGLLRKGGTIVENTSGNTGFGLAVAAAVKGYRCIFTIPDKMSVEKVRLLRGLGAEVVVVPTAVRLRGLERQGLHQPLLALCRRLPVQHRRRPAEVEPRPATPARCSGPRPTPS